MKSERAKISKSIEEIAYKANLLALKAALEAARVLALSGEEGAGIVVVANEVSKLALQAAKSAKKSLYFDVNSRRIGYGHTYGEFSYNRQPIQKEPLKKFFIEEKENLETA